VFTLICTDIIDRQKKSMMIKMPRYRCDVCNVFEYESERGSSTTNIKPGTDPINFPDGWRCPICDSDKTHLKLVMDTTPLKSSVSGSLPRATELTE